MPKPSTGFKRNMRQINGIKSYYTQRDKDTSISGNSLFFAESDIVNRGDIPDKKIAIYICPILMLFSTGICYVATVRQKSRFQGYLVESVHTFPHFMVLYAIYKIISDTACMTNMPLGDSVSLEWNLYIVILFTNEMHSSMASKGFVRRTVFP